MEKQLKGYIPYEDKDYKDIWENSYIVIDTNVILNFYRYSDTTREELWKILEILKERLWLPYQISFEYLKNREKIIDNVENSFTKIKEEFRKNAETLKNKLQTVDKKDMKCKDEIINVINKSNEEIEKMIEKEKKEQQDFKKQDIVLKKVLELFNGKCSERETEDKIKEIKLEANRRGENKIPPGYLDYKKQENYGDYYIFYSLKQKSKKEKKHIIFVTDDDKEDWYLKKDGIIKSGRRELLQEFYAETKQLIFICTTDSFLKSYNKYCSGKAPKKVIEETQDIREKEKLEIKNEQFRKINLRPTTMMRSERLELLDKIKSMKMYLIRMIKDSKETERLLETVEYIAKSIIENIKYEKYHGKILMVVDKLEKSIEELTTIYECMMILNDIIEEIKVD